MACQLGCEPRYHRVVFPALNKPRVRAGSGQSATPGQSSDRTRRKPRAASLKLGANNWVNNWVRATSCGEVITSMS